MKNKNLVIIILTGALFAIAAWVLTFGMTLIPGATSNPGNMGFCIACFLRDTAGAYKMHTAGVVQYLRPEIIGLILGAFVLSLAKKEFKPRGGSAPMARFLLGMTVMVGALVFLGCPLRMVLRMAAGDLNAWVGLIGFILGVFVGTLFLKKGFAFPRSEEQSLVEGLIFPITQIVGFVLLVAFPAVLAFSTEGPGAAHAPILVSLGAALIVGALAQHSRLCQAGSIKHVFLSKNFDMFWGGLAIFVVALILNLVSGTFKLGFADQPIAHTEWIWNIVGLFIVGLGSVLLGGCPMRQLILAGSGNTDSAITVVGMIVGAAFAHNLGLASSAKGTTPAGRIAAIAGVIIMLVIAFTHLKKKDAKAK